METQAFASKAPCSSTQLRKTQRQSLRRVIIASNKPKRAMNFSSNNDRRDKERKTMSENCKTKKGHQSHYGTLLTPITERRPTKPIGCYIESPNKPGKDVIPSLPKNNGPKSRALINVLKLTKRPSVPSISQFPIIATSKVNEQAYCSPPPIHTNYLTKHSGLYKKSPPPATDMEIWKNRNSVPADAKVFIIQGRYDDIRQALLNRGWAENPDNTSVCFDLKWAVKAKDIDHENLLPSQIVNHFAKNSAITTKMGLCESLRKLIWFNNVDINTFYPKCYNLVESGDITDFIEEFKVVLAESILKRFMKGDKEPQMKILVALEVCKRKVMDLDEILNISLGDMPAVTKEEWDVLNNEGGVERKDSELWLKRLQKKFNYKLDKVEKKAAKLVIKEQPLLDQVAEVLSKLQKKSSQFFLNGSKNIWIVKPAGLSRGRGIKMFDNLKGIMEYAQCKDQQYVVQKYIENPMIIVGRKFDIRQWVLVSSWNPVTVWFYEECYIRFGAVEYQLEDFANKYMHLTNNSVTKHFQTPHQEIIEGNMWDQEAFCEHLKHKYGKDLFQEKLLPAMKKIVIWSLESAQDSVINRRNTVELFGYDFMVDEDANPWLIEINSSPAMDYSTVILMQENKNLGGN
eukprot:TRINITY_DN1966_c0_g1_i1.p1 TRINITY_DN1966_c0_g1~~TRINITY_DN1966_c0_g1_i1.p1  ORF type:complete len:661 (-),score=53.58 TRINITY_DN1966_c0_g1_i1:1643-3529(-)